MDLHKLGPQYVLIKGGHLMTPPPLSSPPATPAIPSQTPEHSASSSAAPSASHNESDAEPVTEHGHRQDQQGSGRQAEPHASDISRQGMSSSLEAAPGQQHQDDAASTNAELASVATADGASVQQQTEATAASAEAESAATASGEAPDRQQATANSETLVQQQTPTGDPAEKHESHAGAIDVLFDGEEITILESRRVHTHNTHGTGMHMLITPMGQVCTYSQHPWDRYTQLDSSSKRHLLQGAIALCCEATLSLLPCMEGSHQQAYGACRCRPMPWARTVKESAVLRYAVLCYNSHTHITTAASES